MRDAEWDWVTGADREAVFEDLLAEFRKWSAQRHARLSREDGRVSRGTSARVVDDLLGFAKVRLQTLLPR